MIAFSRCSRSSSSRSLPLGRPARGNAGHARDRTPLRGRRVAVLVRRRRLPVSCGACRATLFSRSGSRPRLAPRPQHRLQRLGLFIEFQFDEFHRALQCDALRFQVDLARDAGTSEIFTVFRRSARRIFSVRSATFPRPAPAAASSAETPRRGICRAQVGLIGAGIDLAHRLLDQCDLVAVLCRIDRLLAMAARSRPIRARMPSWTMGFSSGGVDFDLTAMWIS